MLEDISKLILDSHGLDETLLNIVRLVSDRMRTEVCSIYLRDDQQLTMRATIGLPEDLVGHTELRIGEGLIGYTAETRAVVNVNEPQSHARFRYVESSNEESYHSFLGIPLFDRQNLLGVMAIQTIEPREFDAIEISMLTTIAFQLSTVVANARLLDRLEREQVDSPASLDRMTPANRSAEIVSILNGSAAFAGVAIGPAFLIDDVLGSVEIRDDEPVDSLAERNRLDESLEKARVETLCLEKRVAERLSEEDAAIFHSHLMILQDRVLTKKLHSQIDEGRSAVAAVKHVIAEYVAAFRRMEDPYLRERAADMEDIGRRVTSHLLGHDRGAITINRPAIVVAKELMPSEIAMMDPHQILGLVLESDDSNGHAVIIAKSLGIPTLIGVKQALHHIEPGAPLILDANSGCLHIEPGSEVRKEYGRLQADNIRHQEQLMQYRDRDAATLDGTQVMLRANVGLFSDVEIAHRSGASGVGLYRTELPYMARADFPDRQSQYEVYRRVVESFPGQSVTIRTLDIGGDKMLPYFDAPSEENPFLGWRSVRVSLDHRDMFRTQIEAILMASTHGHVKLMFPMVTNIEEIHACKEVVSEAQSKLHDEGWILPHVPFGIMVEVPAAISLADHFAREVDFFALGTNDLVQYMLAADRGNSRIRHYYDALHPAILHAIHHMVGVASRHNRGLCICGEMASDPACFAILVGLGLREFSISSPSILSLKARLSKLSIGQLRKLAQVALSQTRGSDIRSLAEDLLREPGDESTATPAC
ncbi:phosphoenolpyruvate--protein phosphotransferase [Novipirellula artificiosorum]|uniref:phosphoenolpyruvate--protein phosphotransferase n=1 Tax=Novipirellula artificiosorum TaxID=2528016 RepID=A0A5C6DBY1_9BACT|nr:phosphoenolpyruvate--protein phosphotransferase [Novipirellula artificiosorum]TWU33297.1 Phosphoenolpyruvate-protein phosphotransferase [Novipirellula artificiosorum]